MLRKKPYIQKSKTAAEQQLATRVDFLKTEGISDQEIGRDTKVRQFKGKIRQAIKQLSSIAAVEQGNAQRAALKAEKLAAPKMPRPKKEHAIDPAKKKTKREKRVAGTEA